MERKFLYEELDTLRKYGHNIDIPEIVQRGLSKKIELRKYQEEALKNFLIYYDSDTLKKNKQIHTLFHMATGSGKTIIMASLILHLYTKGYRKFLFFVNQTNVLEKTIENFTNTLSTKYLFNQVIEYLGNKIKIKKVNSFSENKFNDDIEIVFTTTQSLHLDLINTKENSITYESFENHKVVFISDESHHINSLTKKASKDEEKAITSWENTVMNAFRSNKDSIMLEFTATCDLKDKNVLAKYKDKIVYDYPLAHFRESGYTKDFQNFATDTNLWTRTLIALVMSEYRKFLFGDLKLNIKPVIMLKSQKIAESEAFYNEFFKKIKNLKSDEISNLELAEIDILNEAINYFRKKDNSLEILEYSIKNSFTKNTSIIMNGSSDNNKENQLLVNSLEDIDNPIRLIFAVDMLNEGWDVLNLFDIVRLYDTRQASSKAGKIGLYTIKEAQLIGRGARYCPFVDGDEEYKFKRKYDLDLSNKNRVLETMYFHSKNDSKYISELRQALIETGLQAPDAQIIKYKLKDSFKNSEFYKTALVFSNKRDPKGRKNIISIEPSMKNKIYTHTTFSGKGDVFDLFGNKIKTNKNKVENKKIKNIKFKEIDLNVLLGTSEYFEELRFDVLKQKYPTLKSKIEFLTSENFLGNSILEITYSSNKLSGRDLFLALKDALHSVSSHVSSLKQEFCGSKDFSPRLLKDVLKDKTIYVSDAQRNGGKGDSQTFTINNYYKLDLRNEDWYVFDDNFGTSEEKLFIKYFKREIEPLLKEKDLEFYIIRNERIPELAIYSFEAGERFEPDFILFVREKQVDKTLFYQGYIEPKGSHLLKQDEWKEKFLLEIDKKFKVDNLFHSNYKIIGLPFFNNVEKQKEFDEAFKKILEKLPQKTIEF
ncbi:DEAD/DEAH box helicase family protein [Mycoplasmopsis pulmonis]|nr:DEAD/DEAH box helicase family protein [Mycoplasmopsis pulmonis]